jgi:hypothetical protein
MPYAIVVEIDLKKIVHRKALAKVMHRFTLSGGSASCSWQNLDVQFFFAGKFNCRMVATLLYCEVDKSHNIAKKQNLQNDL